LENTVVWQYQDAAYGRNHPDGLSVMGNYIVHGISCKGGLCETGSDMPRIYVWDAANPEEPKLVLDFDLVNWLGTPNDTASAGAAALVKISGTQYMLVVKSKESHRGGTRRVVRFLSGSSLTDIGTWTEIGVLPESQIDLWDGPGDFNYQGIDAVTECTTGKVYLVATKGHEEGLFSGCSGNSEVARLYEVVDYEVGNPRLLVKGHRYFKCDSDGSITFNAAAGVYVSPDHRLNFYAAERKFQEVDTGFKVKFFEFWH
jgi:hypothetical protein